MQKDRFQLFILYLILLFQGMAFAMLPALSNLLIDPGYFHLSSYAYGIIFIPFVLAAILMISLSSGIYESEALKNYLGAGLVFNVLGMLFLSMSFIAPAKSPINALILGLVSLFCGSGFGTLVPVLQKLLKQTSSLFIALSLGSAAAALLAIYFQGEGLAWLAPLSAAVAFFLLFNFSYLLPVIDFEGVDHVQQKTLWSMPWTFWLFFTITLLYGFCETSLGNWIPYYTQTVKKLSFSQSTGALATFWMFVAIGRGFVLFITRWVSYKWFYAFLPLLIFWVLGLIPELFKAGDLITVSAIAGLSCSAFLRLNILFGEDSAASHSPWVFGGLLTAYLVGYGLAAYGIGELLHIGKIPLEAIFPFASLPASLMTIFSWIAIYFFRGQRQAS